MMRLDPVNDTNLNDIIFDLWCKNRKIEHQKGTPPFAEVDNFVIKGFVQTYVLIRVCHPSKKISIYGNPKSNIEILNTFAKFRPEITEYTISFESDTPIKELYYCG